MENYFGKNGFVWFVGVVEDRMDPEKLGRVRVRCLGHHSPHTIDIPTEHLSWSTVMAPTTNPSMDGLGSTPPFLVEGSWVTGFFLDQFKQDSIIVGSLPSFNETPKSTDPELLKAEGFRDHNGVYPFNVEPDTNKLARGEFAEYHDSLIARRVNRITDIPKATKAHVPTVGGPDEEVRTTWSELNPKSNIHSKYPYNHVTESESGHVMEIDDSPGGERLMTYHRTGTFDEIHPDGSKVTKIVGSEYEITLENKNVLIEGSCNITISGDCRHLIKGDYILEVEGDMTTKVHGSRHVKIGAGDGGDDLFEIRGNRSGNINDTEYLRIGGDKDVRVDMTEVKDIGRTLLIVTGGTHTVSNGGNHRVTAPRIDLN
jgi:hypothetical protein